MPEDLREGLYLTGIGMGVVFSALSGFLLVMLALRKLFPGEETSPTGQGEGTPGKEPQAREKRTSTELPEPPQATGSQSYGGVTGAQIAAIAAAAYMSVEQETDTGQSDIMTPAPIPSQVDSGWSTRARALLTKSQSRRPPPYQQKPHSAYSPRVGLG